MKKLFGSLMVTRFRGPFKNGTKPNRNRLRGDPFPLSGSLRQSSQAQGVQVAQACPRRGASERSKVFSRRNQRHVGSVVFFLGGGDLERNTGKKQILTRLTRSFNLWKVCDFFSGGFCFLKEKIGWITFYFSLGIQSPNLRMVLEPEYFAFRFGDWVFPIVPWQGDWIPWQGDWIPEKVASLLWSFIGVGKKLEDLRIWDIPDSFFTRGICQTYPRLSQPFFNRKSYPPWN